MMSRGGGGDGEGVAKIVMIVLIGCMTTGTVTEGGRGSKDVEKLRDVIYGWSPAAVRYEIPPSSFHPICRYVSAAAASGARRPLGPGLVRNVALLVIFCVSGIPLQIIDSS